MIRLRKLLAVLAVTLTAGATTAAIGAVAAPVATPASASQPLTTPTQVGGSVLEEGFSVMATDGLGDVFGNDSTVGSGSVSWLAHSSSGYAPQQDLYLTNPPNISGAMYVEGLATDSNSDIFASVYNPGVSSSVVELTRSGSGYSNAAALPFGGLTTDATTGIAVDATGDVFVDNNGTVDELTRTAGGYGPQLTLGFSGI